MSKVITWISFFVASSLAVLSLIALINGGNAGFGVAMFFAGVTVSQNLSTFASWIDESRRK